MAKTSAKSILSRLERAVEKEKKKHAIKKEKEAIKKKIESKRKELQNLKRRK